MTIIEIRAGTRRFIDVVRSKVLSGFTFRQYLHGAAAFSTIVGLTAGLVPADPLAKSTPSLKGRKGPPPKERPFHAFQSVETIRSAGGRHRTSKHIAQNIDMIDPPGAGVFGHVLRLPGCK